MPHCREGEGKKKEEMGGIKRGWRNQLWLPPSHHTLSTHCSYKVLTTHQPQYLHDSISVQPCHNTRSSSMVTLARPPTRSSLKITNRSFGYAAPCLWNELPADLREPRQTQSPALSPITHGSSSSSPSSLSPLASSLTRSEFHSELKTWLFSKSFPP